MGAVSGTAMQALSTEGLLISLLTLIIRRSGRALSLTLRLTFKLPCRTSHPDGPSPSLKTDLVHLRPAK
jgi:hypothetical protein